MTLTAALSYDRRGFYWATGIWYLELTLNPSKERLSDYVRFTWGGMVAAWILYRPSLSPSISLLFSLSVAVFSLSLSLSPSIYGHAQICVYNIYIYTYIHTHRYNPPTRRSFLSMPKPTIRCFRPPAASAPSGRRSAPCWRRTIKKAPTSLAQRMPRASDFRALEASHLGRWMPRAFKNGL